ncbi:hypothetical protein P5V15_005882 [Pogonomyrmex californicus]
MMRALVKKKRKTMLKIMKKMDGYNVDEQNTSSSSKDENNDVAENRGNLMKSALKNAFLEANLNHNQRNILLKILHELPFHLIHLSKDTRTLLQTPTVVAARHVQQICGGEYLHMGLKSTLMKKLESIPYEMLPKYVEIDFSTNGA